MGANLQFVADAMRRSHSLALSGADRSVAAGRGSCQPLPARSERGMVCWNWTLLVDLFPETLSQWPTLRHVRLHEVGPALGMFPHPLGQSRFPLFYKGFALLAAAI